jgi:Family of unknown function (DUF6152)
VIKEMGMENKWSSIIALGIACLAAPPALRAHHAFAAEFDASKSITLTGTVSKVAWTNPHAHIHLDVTGQGGRLRSWDFELGSPNALIRRGWLKSTVKPGDVITVVGYVAKDGSDLANARSITMSDGRKVFAGSSLESEPAK